MKPIIKLNKILRHFGGVKALDGVTLEIRSGEVLALAGANGSGKSTLIKVIAGVETSDSGTLIMHNNVVRNNTASHAIKSGVQVIYQDMSLFDHLTIAENIAASADVMRQQKLFRKSDAAKLASKIISDLEIELPLGALVASLTVAERQLVAICRALACDVKVLFMDEPTTALTWTEVERLFAIVNRLTQQGVAVVFVSHKSDEVFAISQRIAVLRNGQLVAEGAREDFDKTSLHTAISGEEAPAPAVPREFTNSKVVIEVENLSSDRAFSKVSMSIRQGEILGLTGSLGSGRNEFAEALFGVRKHNGGTITLDGVQRSITSPKQAREFGIALVPEDRLTEGIFLGQSIEDNIVSASTKQNSNKLGVLKNADIESLCDNSVRDLRIKLGSMQDPIESLSGGNQQKVVLAKWLARAPKVLVLIGPTVGVDVGAKHAIIEKLKEAADSGLSILLISDDLDELRDACDRVLVFDRGQIISEVVPAQLTEQTMRGAGE